MTIVEENKSVSYMYYSPVLVFAEYTPGPAPAILDWYGHCVRVSVNKLGGSGGMLPQENF